MQKVLKNNWKGLLLSLLLLTYYVILATNWELGIRVASNLIRLFPPIIGWLLTAFLYMLIPMALKGGYASAEFSLPRPMWLRLLAIFVGPLLLIGFCLVVFFWHRIDLPATMARHHWLILSCASAALVAVLFFGLLLGSDIEEFLDGFKTFPMLSPFVCFSAPAAWKDALTKFGVSDGGARTLAILLFGAGVFFLFSLVFLWTAKAQRKHSTVGRGGGLYGPDGLPLPVSTPKASVYFPLSLACLIMAMLPTFLAVFELAYAIGTQQKNP